MRDCDTCLNTRVICSENGYHTICSLHHVASYNCITGKKNHYIRDPRVKKDAEPPKEEEK